MRTMKAKSQKSSMNSHAEIRSAAQVSQLRQVEPSASAMADRFCDEMIENLRNNIAASKKRLRQAIQV
jgi:hypothetical protein